MTKKQHKAIAEMWAAGLLLQTGVDSFGSETDNKDADAILKEVDRIAVRLLRGRKQTFTLKDTISEVLNQKEDKQ